MLSELESTVHVEEGQFNTLNSLAVPTLHCMTNSTADSLYQHLFWIQPIRLEWFLPLSHSPGHCLDSDQSQGENNFRFYLRKSLPGRYVSSHRGEERPREQGVQSVGVTREKLDAKKNNKKARAHCFSWCAERLEEATPSPSQGTLFLACIVTQWKKNHSKKIINWIKSRNRDVIGDWKGRHFFKF